MSLFILTENEDKQISTDDSYVRSNDASTTNTMATTGTTSNDEIKKSTDNSQMKTMSFNNSIKRDKNVEKPLKLCVVVSDADEACNPSTTNSHLLSVNVCETIESIKALPTRQRSSTCSNHQAFRSREQSSKKIIEERFRRGSCMLTQNNSCQSPDMSPANQQTINFLRSRRCRLGHSEPNLVSLQMDLPFQVSASVKTSPRTSLVAPSTFQIGSRRSSMRRPNLTALNLINLKYALRKQLSPQNASCAIFSDPAHDVNLIDSMHDRRWSLASAPSSSGYGTTSPSASHYSSFERLQHYSHVCTCKHSIDANCHDDFQRLESRSLSMSLLDANLLSSPLKTITPEQDINAMAYIYKERYPKAKIQMEERLQSFIDTYKLVDKFDYCSDGSARFIHNQIVELAKDCLEVSNNDLITTLYFNEMTVNLEALLLNAIEKCPQAIENLQTVVRKLLLITSRSARLLECLQFDPEDFLRTLEHVECQAKTFTILKQDIPKYICSKLNLERNPLDIIEGLQATELTTNDNISASDNTVDLLKESNYLTITPGSNHPPLERTPSLSVKSPCEEDFEILKLVSNGAYGAVHLVKHRQTHERYAMKKISKTNLILRNQIEQAFVERDIMTFTDNPFVVALICTFETKNHLCLVMEYVEGGDVATLLKNIGGPLNIDIARMYFAETTLAVEYLHSYGIIHRDLKPDNLLITAVGHIKLTDFGLSKVGLMSLTTSLYEKLADKETKTFNDKQICGTPTYIAPEVILRRGYGKPVDWWSMGIMLYEFLVGIPPFTGNTPDELFANIINGSIDWDQLTGDLDENSADEIICRDAKDLIEQLLQHEPSKRLGALGGAHEIRAHSFCSSINWSSLLREKADFVPVLESPDDTSYFDTRLDRYKHSDDDKHLAPSTNYDSDSLFASFSSVSLKYASELSGNPKHRHSLRPDNGSNRPGSNVGRTMSCTETLGSSHVVQIDLPHQFKPLAMSQSLTTESVETQDTRKEFDLHTFEAFVASSDESESSSKVDDSSSSSLSSSQKMTRTNDTKLTTADTTLFEQSNDSLNTIRKQNSIDSSDDNYQLERTQYRHQKKSRIPRAVSPTRNSLNVQTILSVHENHCPPSSPTCSKTIRSNQQHDLSNAARTPSKSFSSSSSSSSPPPILLNSKDDRAYRKNSRSKMTFSPLERDATSHIEQQLPVYTSARPSSIHSMTNSLRPPIVIRRGPRSFGFTLRAVKVFHGNTDYFTTQHMVVSVRGPAEEAGLKSNDIITHVNEQPVSGLGHSEVVRLILSGSEILSIRAVPCSETQIRTGGRRRSPSKQKNRYQQQTERKGFSSTNDTHHQSHCLKHRMNSAGNVLGTSPNRKYQHNTSLFRRLSEKKVARDIEAAAAAGSISLTVPSTCLHSKNKNNAYATSTTRKSDCLSSSLLLLSFNELMSDDDNEQNLSSHQESDRSEWSSTIPSTSSNHEVDSSQSNKLICCQRQKSLSSHLQLTTNLSTLHQPKYQSLCKTSSEPRHLIRQNSTSSSQTSHSCRRIHQDSYRTYAQMASLPKKTILRPPFFNILSPSQALKETFEWETYPDCHVQPNCHDSLSRSFSVGSSTNHNSDNRSPKTDSPATKVYYRRK